jgi:Exostosin family
MPAFSLKAFQELNLPLAEIISGRIGFIHDLFLALPYEIRDTLPDGSDDLVIITGKEDRGTKLDELATYPGRVIVVFAPGDAPIRGAYVPGRRGLPRNIVAAYATNNELADRRVINVPLGVRTNKLKPLQFVRQNHTGGRQGLVYGNFTLNPTHYREKGGGRHVREKLVDQLGTESWARLDIDSKHRDSADELMSYYSQLASHRFSLSPEGNGVDCYRTWESLYLGAIPIVMVSPTMTTFKDLPILFTEDYSELSEEYLEIQWREMSRRVFEFNAMLKSWYFHQFLDAVALLTEPRFVCWGFAGTRSEKFHDVLTRSSRSPSDVAVETPVAPFTASSSLMESKTWHAPGDLKLESDTSGLQVLVEGLKNPVAETALNTIAGAPFKVTALLHPDSASDRLTIGVAERGEMIASTEITGVTETEIVLDFVARSDRTVLMLRPVTPSAGASWAFSELMVSTQV